MLAKRDSLGSGVGGGDPLSYICRTGRREQWSSCGVKDGRRRPDQIYRSMSAWSTHRATRPSAGASPAGSWVVPRRWAGGWESPAARFLFDLTVICRRALQAGRQLGPGAPTCAPQPPSACPQPARHTSHSTRTFNRLPACLCPSPGSPRAGRFWQPEAVDPRPSGAPSLRRTAAG